MELLERTREVEGMKENAELKANREELG